MNVQNVAYKRKSAQLRQQELIQAGITCLGNGGMSGFTIDQICKTAGVSRGLINHHFSSKDDLLVRIYSEMTDHLIDERTWETPIQKLKAIIDVSFDAQNFNKSNLRAWLSVWGQVPTNAILSKMHRARYKAYKKRIKSALNEELGESEARLQLDSIARQLIALIDGLWLEYCLNSDGFSLASARSDCYRFLTKYGIPMQTDN
jgi:TetR/AcrR family transcriptional repressor of bet genes